MNWSKAVQGLSDLLGLILIVRLLRFKLHRVYGVFCIYLGFGLVFSSVAFLETVLRNATVAPNALLDYRVIWLATRPVDWCLSLWMVYSLLEASLGKLTGILKYSKRLLNIVFAGSLLVASLIARPEYTFSGLTNYKAQLAKAVIVSIVIERVISMSALVVLVCILGFILWFPLQMPRNLALFSFGYVFYFSVKTGLMLAQSYMSPQISRTVNDLIIIVLGACYAYWILFITPEGEAKLVRVGHAWHSGTQPEYLNQLEAINTALLRARKAS